MSNINNRNYDSEFKQFSSKLAVGSQQLIAQIT